MGKIYNVVLSRPIGADPTIPNQTFFYDWSQIEEGRYRCSFSFVGTAFGTVTGQFHPLVFIDLGQSNYTMFARQPTVLSAIPWSQDYIGSLETLLTGTNLTTYIATTETNPPFYLDNRPRNNLVNVRIYSQRGIQNSLFGNTPGNYALTLQLEKIDDVLPPEPTTFRGRFGNLGF